MISQIISVYNYYHLQLEVMNCQVYDGKDRSRKVGSAHIFKLSLNNRLKYIDLTALTLPNRSLDRPSNSLCLSYN